MPRNPAIVQGEAGNIHQRDFFRDESSEVTTTGRAENTEYTNYMTMESSENVIADISSRSRASRSSWRWTAFACNSATSFSSFDYGARCQRNQGSVVSRTYDLIGYVIRLEDGVTRRRWSGIQLLSFGKISAADRETSQLTHQKQRG